MNATVLALVVLALAATPRPAAHASSLPRTVRCRPAVLDLAPGETYPVEVLIPSPTGHKANVQVSLDAPSGIGIRPDRWEGTVPPEGKKLYPQVTLAAPVPSAIGPAPAVEIATQFMGGSGPGGRFAVHVAEPSLQMIPGAHELRIRVHNPFFGRAFNGRVQVANPDRFLQNVNSRLLHIPPGLDEEVAIPLPGASPAPGAAYQFTATLQSWQGYKRAFSQRLKFPAR